jgi:hypothetical protein
MRTLIAAVLATVVLALSAARAQRAADASGQLRIALAKQPFSPTGTSPGPTTMANGGIQQALAQLGAVIRIDEAALTPDEATEYGAWKRLGMALDQARHHDRERAGRDHRGYSRAIASCNAGWGWMPWAIWIATHAFTAWNAIEVVAAIHCAA